MAAKIEDMNEQGTTDPHTGLDKVFAALRRIPVRRRTDDKWISGVCSGLADRLGVDPVIVRVALVVLTFLGGIGLTLYLVAWALLPDDKDQIAAERATRDGDGGSIVLLVVTVFALFGASTWGSDNRWFVLVPLVVFVWWLAHRSYDRPDADHRVSAYQPGTYPAGPPMPYASAPSPAPYPGAPPAPFTAGPPPAPYPGGPSPTAPRPAAPKVPRRRSGGPLMGLLAIGLALVTYGSLSWLGTEYQWNGDHHAIAIAGSLAAIGLLLVVLGIAGWRSGFVAFLAVALAITAWSSTVVPDGIRIGGRVGDATWAPTSVPAKDNYHLGVGDGVLDLTGLPPEGLSEAKIPAYVGIGELTVIVPEDLTVRVMGHAALGAILLPADAGNNGQGGTDVARSVVIGDGPTEVVVDAGVGIGQLTVVKE